jgi:hypothetical protein
LVEIRSRNDGSRYPVDSERRPKRIDVGDLVTTKGGFYRPGEEAEVAGDVHTKDCVDMVPLIFHDPKNDTIRNRKSSLMGLYYFKNILGFESQTPIETVVETGDPFIDKESPMGDPFPYDVEDVPVDEVEVADPDRMVRFIARGTAGVLVDFPILQTADEDKRTDTVADIDHMNLDSPEMTQMRLYSLGAESDMALPESRPREESQAN